MSKSLGSEVPGFVPLTFERRIGMPHITVVRGEQTYPDRISVRDIVDMVDIFHRSDTVAPSVDRATTGDVQTIWMQRRLVDEQAACSAPEVGISVIIPLRLRRA